MNSSKRIVKKVNYDGNSKKQDKNIKLKLKLDFSKIRSKEYAQKKQGENNELLTSQRKTIFDISKQFRILQDQLIGIQNKMKDKDETISNNQEIIQKQKMIIQQNNEKFNQLDIQNTEKAKLFNEYKETSIKDYANKESQILELKNKKSDLEDEMFKLLYLKKKDKKKILSMETTLKKLNNDLLRVKC